MKYYIYIAFLLFLSCGNNNENIQEHNTPKLTFDSSVFPELKNVDQLPKTDFSPTFESKFDINQNIIYGATIPMAWTEIKNKLGYIKEIESDELKMINTTTSHEKVLNQNEYKTSIAIEENLIKASAYFKKTLPFEEPFRKSDDELKFNNKPVESFGFWGYSSQTKINYFNSNNDFSISLLPSNKEHEILLILFKNKKIALKNLSDYFKHYTQSKKSASEDNCTFNDDDQVEVPIIEFHLEKYFDSIIGTSFSSKKNGQFYISQFYQRNAFVLNENGAEVESYAEEAAECVEEIEEEKIEPKKMIFDRPFVVFLKRKDATNPYFGVYISNTDLLKEVK